MTKKSLEKEPYSIVTEQLGSEIKVAYVSGKGMRLWLDGVAWEELKGVEKSVPAPTLLLERIIKNRSADSSRFWTDFVFLFCRERIAVRAQHDRRTNATLVQVFTNGEFFIDEEEQRVVGQAEKPIE